MYFCKHKTDVNSQSFGSSPARWKRRESITIIQTTEIKRKMEPTNKTRHAKTKRTNLLLVLIALLLPTGVFAQKVTKVETKTESNASKMDSQQYKWKLYRYDNGTYAAYTTDGTRITPNAKIRPLYVGGGLFKLSTMQKNKYGEYIYAVYDDHGELVIPDTMSCVDIFHCGDGIYKPRQTTVSVEDTVL